MWLSRGPRVPDLFAFTEIPSNRQTCIKSPLSLILNPFSGNVATQIGSPRVTTGLVNHNWQFSQQIANVAVRGPAGGTSRHTPDT